MKRRKLLVGLWYLFDPMLRRLGVGAIRRRDWFTKFSLSRALHARPEEIQKWIDRGWLKARD
jgi:hypothetical protein